MNFLILVENIKFGIPRFNHASKLCLPISVIIFGDQVISKGCIPYFSLTDEQLKLESFLHFQEQLHQNFHLFSIFVA